MRTPGIPLMVLAGASALALALVAAGLTWAKGGPAIIDGVPAAVQPAPMPAPAHPTALAKAGPAFIDGVPNNGQQAPAMPAPVPVPVRTAAMQPAPAPAPSAPVAATSSAPTDSAGKAAPDTKAGGSHGIFVPKPKGAGDTLDETVEVAATPEDRPDVVTTRRGDQFHGSVLGIGPRGALRVSSPEFEGELLLAATELERIDLHGVEASAAPARPAELKAGQARPSQTDIVLAGGDRIVGTLVSMTADAVTIDTPVAGRLRIAASAVRSISFHRAEVLIDSAFGAGVMGQWVDGGQNVWTISDGAATNGSRNLAGVGIARGEMAGALMAARGGNMESPLYAPLDHAEAITMVAKVSTPDARAGQAADVRGSLPNSGFSCDLVLFADAPGGSSRVRRYGRSSIFGVFGTSQAYPIVNLNGSSGTMLGTRSYGHQLSGGVLRFAYDPATSKAQLWVDEVALGSYTVPNPPTSGKYVMFNSLSPVRIESLRVLRGVVSPEDDGFITSMPAAGETVVELSTKERLTVSRVVTEGAQVTLTTAGGEVRHPIDKVRCILFGGPDKAAAGKPAVAGQGQVRTDGCWLTMRLDRITDGEVAGQSDVFGEVKIRRAAVREIRFNTDQPAGAAKAATPATGASNPAEPVRTPARVMLPRAAILP